MSKIPALDAGHGGKDAGAVNGKRYEKDDALRMVLRVEDLLKKQGVTAELTRKDDTYVELYSRPKFANNKNTSVMASFHRNSYKDETANGVEIWVHPQAPNADTLLASEILERLAHVGIQSNRGVKYGSYVVLTTNSNIPAIMIELGFISNTKDNELFDSNFDEYCIQIAKGICSQLGVVYTEKNPPTKPQEFKGYRLMASYNENINYAQDNVKKLRAGGFDNAYLMAIGKGYRTVAAYNENTEYAKENLEKAKNLGFTTAYLMIVSDERVEKE